MKDIKSLIDCSIITLTVFLSFSFFAPLFNDNIALLAVALYFLLPLVCLFCGVYCGSKSGFSIIYPLIAGLLFLIPMFMVLNYTAWIFVVVYVVAALLGEIIGSFFKSNTSGRRKNGRLR